MKIPSIYSLYSQRILPLLIAVVAVLFPNLVWAASAAHGGEHGIPTMPIVYAAINFGILLLVLVFVLRKPVKEFFATRTVLIQQDISESQALKAQAQERYQEYESRLKNIAAESQALKDEFQKNGQLEQKRLIENAQRQAQMLQETTQRMMAQELKRAKEELKRDSVELAAQMAEDLLKKNLTPQDQQRLVQDYLGKMNNYSA